MYFLTDKSGESYHISNGVVQASAQARPLPETPDGWQEVAIAWERDLTKVGVGRNFSAPLGFVGDGASILRHIFYTQSYEKELFLIIARLTLELTDDTYRWRYTHFYKGDIDLSTFKDDGTRVSVKVGETSLQKKLKAREGTTYEIPIDEHPEKIRVLMDGVLLQSNRQLLIAEWQQPSMNDNGWHNVGVYNIQSEGDAPGLATFDVIADREAVENFENDTRYFLTTLQPIQGLHLFGSVTIAVPGVLVPYKLMLFSSKGKAYELLNVTAPSVFAYRNFPFDFTFDSEAGENWFLLGSVGGPGDDGAIYYKETRVILDFQSALKQSFVYCLKPSTVFSELTTKIAEQEGVSKSDLINRRNNLCLTSGDAVRGLEKTKIKTSLNQFFEFCRITMGAGMAIDEGKLIIEPYNYFFATDNPIPLGKIKNLNVSLATDLLGNTLKIGYNEQNTDSVSGKYSFNNTHIYTSEVTRIAKELTMVCPYYADPYAIEITRINLEGKVTTDNSNDNSIFIINVDLSTPYEDENGVYYKLKRRVYDQLEGVPTDTVFNVEELTPKRLALQQSEWLASIFYPFQGHELKYQTTEKNGALRTVWQSPIASIPTVFDEDANIVIGNNLIFLPYYFDFETEVPVNLVELSGTNPRRPFSFEWRGKMYYGFRMKDGIQPDTEAEQSFRLLATPQNNMTNLL